MGPNSLEFRVPLTDCALNEWKRTLLFPYIIWLRKSMCVLASASATTIRTDPLQYVVQNTLQRAQQTTVHYCMITICLWDCEFKPGSDPAGDSCPIPSQCPSIHCALCTVHCIINRPSAIKERLIACSASKLFRMNDDEENVSSSPVSFWSTFKACDGLLPGCSRWCQTK